QQARLKSKPEGTLTKPEQRQLKDISLVLDGLKSAAAMLAEAEGQLNDPFATPTKLAGYEAQRKDAQAMLERWQRQAVLKKLLITDLDVGISGLGDVFADDFSVDQALQRGVTIYGRGKDQQIVSGITATGASVRLGA